VVKRVKCYPLYDNLSSFIFLKFIEQKRMEFFHSVLNRKGG